MRVDECYQLGYIVKTHGLKGEVTVHLDVDNPLEYKELESVFVLQEDNLVPFFITSMHISGSRSITQFEEIDSLEHARQLVGSELFLPLTLLPALPEGEYYQHELIGLTVFHDQQKLGMITSLYQPSSQTLAAVDMDGTEILIPVASEIFIHVDLEARRVDVKLPEGLLDIYTHAS